MFKINNWKEPIYKNDLINVIVNGLIAAILGGILAGLLDYLFDMINLRISFGLIIITYVIGSRMRKGYYSYHILYPVLSILFMILSLFVCDVTYMCMIYSSVSIIPIILTDVDFYINFLLSPIYYLYVCFNSFDILYLILGLLNIVIYIWAFRYCYKLVKGRN